MQLRPRTGGTLHGRVAFVEMDRMDKISDPWHIGLDRAGGGMSSFLVPRSSFLVPRSSFLVPRSSFLAGLLCWALVEGTHDASAQDLDSLTAPTCVWPVSPGPTDPGGWGPVWSTDAEGAWLPEVRVLFPAAMTFEVAVTVFLAGGRQLGWTEGPYEGVAPERLVPIDLATVVDETVSAVSVVVSVLDPASGLRTAAAGLTAHAWLDAGGRVVVADEEATRTAVVASELAAPEADLVEEVSWVGSAVRP